MTREEATEILDPETNKAALVRYDDDEARLEACNEACRIAAAVLRERKGQRTEELPGWLDNADSYVCAYCGFEVDNPNRLPGGPWRCPRCGADMTKNVKGAKTFLEDKLAELVSAGTVYVAL